MPPPPKPYTGEITDGYWFAGVSALTAKHKQPIPVYSRVYSSNEKDYVSNNTVLKKWGNSNKFPLPFNKNLLYNQEIIKFVSGEPI